MTANIDPADRAKIAAAEMALEFVEPGMRLGLGTGSTAAWFVQLLGEKVAAGLDVTCVPTSSRTREQAESLGIKLTTLDDIGWLDLTVDGADEIDPALNLIKGGGGCHLVEKIVAAASDTLLVIADDRKLVQSLGVFPLPVEVVPYGWQTTARMIDDLLSRTDVAGKEGARRGGDTPFQTDEGNYVLDYRLDRIGDPAALAVTLNQIPGVVENGLFIDICDTVVIGYGDGKVEVRDINEGTVETDRIDFVDDENLFTDLSE